MSWLDKHLSLAWNSYECASAANNFKVGMTEREELERARKMMQFRQVLGSISDLGSMVERELS